MSKIHDELKRAQEERASDHDAHSQKARIGAGLHIKGQVSGTEDLDVDGKVEGPIQLDGGKLTVGTTGHLIGDVTAREAVIHGKITGNLHVRDCLEIKSSGSAIGDVVTGRVLIEDGAYLKGSIEIGQETVPKSAVASASTKL